MTNKNPRVRPYVALTAYWGNDDVSSTIKVSRRRWEAIQGGAEYGTSTTTVYEGDRFNIGWNFGAGEVSIYGEDGMECVLELPVSELIVEMHPPE